MSLRDRASNLGDLTDVTDMAVSETAKVLSIPKSELYAIKQVRELFTPESLQEMANSLEIEGQIQPIIVCQHDGQGYCIQKGERRWRGAMLSDAVTHLDCIVRPLGSLWGQLAENLIREDLTPFELGKAIEQGKSDDKLDNNGVAKKLGISPAKVSAFLKAANAPQIIKDAYHAGNVGDVDSINSLRIAYELDEKQTLAVLDGPVSRRDAKDLVKRLKNPPQVTTNTKAATGESQAPINGNKSEAKQQDLEPVSIPNIPRPSKSEDNKAKTQAPPLVPQKLRVEVDGEKGYILFVSTPLPGDVVIKLDVGGELIVEATAVRLLGYA